MKNQKQSPSDSVYKIKIGKCNLNRYHALMNLGLPLYLSDAHLTEEQKREKQRCVMARLISGTQTVGKDYPKEGQDPPLG